MREAFAEKNLQYVCKFKDYSGLEKIRIKYGLEVLYTIITKTSGIILLSILFKIFNEAMCLMIAYAFLRIFGHGIHATKSSQCWVASILCYLTFPLIIKYYNINFIYILICWIISFIGFLLWAPADTPQKPLVNKKKRLIYKILTIILSTVLLYISYVTKCEIISDSIFFAFIMGIIAVCPLTYKIFNIPYNNYKNFNKV